MYRQRNLGKGTYDESHRKYLKSGKGKLALKRYRDTEKHRAYMREYKKTHKYYVKGGYKSIPPELKPPKRRYVNYKKSAKSRNHPFNLSLDEFTMLIKSPCFYCSDLPNPFNGVDRKDNNRGYEITNSVPCCEMCNKMKLNYLLEDFINKCIKIVENRKRFDL